MRVHYLQHVPFEGLGSIEPRLKQAGCSINASHLYQDDRLPQIEQFDLLVVMGGPMSINDEQDYAWLAPEKQFIRNAIEAGKAVLGICLGSQLIAVALGARVYANPEKEIGWLPVQAVSATNPAVFRFPPSIEVFHWHGETFDLPPGAVRLASSEACDNQAFQLGDKVIGLQFHLETTPESARSIIENCRDDLVPAKYVQSETQILSAPAQSYQAINRMMAEVLAYLQQTVS